MAKKKSTLSKVIDVALIVLLIFAAGRYFMNQPKNISGEKAKDFVSYLASGKEVRLSDLEGNIILLDFWASWCGPCRRANPDLVDLYKNYHGKKYDGADDFEIVSVGLDKHREKWLQAIKADGLNWKYHLADFDHKVPSPATIYDVKQIPTKFLIDEKGKVLYVNPSFRKIKKYLAGRLQ